MSEFNDQRIDNTTWREREILLQNNTPLYYDGLGSILIIEGSKEDYESALKLLGRQ